MNHTWKEALIPASHTIQEALAAIDASTLQIALVTDDEGRLLGTVTDGDIRRGILRGVPLTVPVDQVMNARPLTVRPTDASEDVLAVMAERRIHQIPILDDERRIVGLHLFDALVNKRRRENWVFLMAGGLGSRLGHLTSECPKPLLEVGGKPVLETIIESFLAQGFHKFYVSVNYRAEMVVQHFGDGSKWGADIRYLHEAQKMGTAGSLTMLPEMPLHPIVVMNGDLLTKLDFGHLLNFHEEQRADATMCIREFSYQVPYGVVKTSGSRLIEIEEKPVHSFFVSAGIYVLSPSVLAGMGKNQVAQMPTVFEDLVRGGGTAAVFPVREYWIDIGRFDDLERANMDFDRVFRGSGA